MKMLAGALALVVLLAAACGKSGGGDGAAAVAPRPGGTVAGLPSEPVAVAQTVTLSGSTLTPPPGLVISQITWGWGDGATGSSLPAGPVSHSYATPGRYTLTVTVQYGDGRTAAWTEEIVAYDAAAPMVEETARAIPLGQTVDVVVVGGSTGAVAAAVAAKNAGASVFLAAPRPYLGEDLCGPLLTWLEAGETPVSALATQLFSTSPARPMYLKRVLDTALENAGVPFITGSAVTEVLRDSGGGLAGVVLANRSGRQAIQAKVIVDATDCAWVARMVGASFAAWPAGSQEFTRVVIGGAARSGPGIASETMSFQIETRPVYPQ